MRHALRFAAALVLSFALPLANSNSAQEVATGTVDPGITRAVEAGESPRVLARLNLAWAPEATLAPDVVGAQQASIRAAADAVEAAIAGTGSRLLRRFETVPYVALQLDGAGLEALVASGAVSRVVPDGLSRSALAQSRPLVQADQAAAAGFDGAGTVVAILDTGVSAGHPFLTGKVVDEACFSDASCPNGGSQQTGSGAGAPCSYAASDCSHGTHVAGIAAGSGGSFSGIAAGASVMAVQVFTRFTNPTCSSFGLPSPCALTYTSDQIAGLEHVYGKRGTFTIAAANMSLGGGRFTSTCDGDARKPVIDNLRAAGIATVVASGNDGFTDAVSAPACISSAIAVGSTTKSDLVSTFSNSAARVALLAPGSSITSSVPGGGYASYSGTSMAAPHVAGAFAVLRDASPGTGVGDALAVLQSSGLAVTDSRNGLTRSRIRINDARQALQPATLTPAATTVTAGSSLNVTAANGPGNRLDWVGFYAVGALDSAHEGRWAYLNGTKTAPGTGLTGATLTFSVPAATGTYEFRFFRDNGFERLATSAPVTVQVSPTAVIQVTPPSLSFGNVNVGEQKLLAVTVTNRGNGTLSGTATASGGFSVFSGGTYSLALDQSATVTVRFAPGGIGPAAGALTLTGGGGASVPLAGDGVQGPSVTPSTTAANVGQGITATVANGPGNATDWVGLFAVGAADNGHEGRWAYLNGTKTAPASGLVSAALPFTLPAVAGNYEFRFFRANGFERLATSSTIVVSVSPDPVLSVTPASLSFGSVSVGSVKDLTVTVKNVGNGTLGGSASAGGAYSVVGGGSYSLGSNQQQVITVRFAPGTSGAANGTLTLTGGGGGSVTLSGTGVVGPSVTPSTTAANVGQGITATVANGPGNATDWVGLFAVGAAENGHEGRWAYLNGTKTAPASGLVSAALPFTLPAVAGNYEFRFFRANGFERLATSSTIVVSVSPDPVLSVTPASLSFGSVSVGSVKDLTVTVKNVGNGTLGGSASAGGAYSVVGGGSYSLGSNQQQVITVRFAPGTSGAANGTLTLTGGGGGTVPLTGSGVVGPSVTPSTTATNVGQGITATVANGPGNALDWVGLYLVGAADNAHEGRWAYLNGTKTAPASGLTSAALPFTLPGVAGNYEFRFFRANGFERLATSATMVVSVSPDPVLSVTPGSLSFGSVSVGSVKDLTVTVKNVGNGTLGGSASAGGAYSVVGGGSYSLGSNQQQVITVRFAPGTSGAANGTLTLTGGGGGTVPLTGSGVAGPRLAPSASSAAPGQVITVQVSDGPGNALDWVGLYLVGAADNAHEGRWAYLNGTKTAPASGSTSAILTFALPATVGDYEFRLYRDNGFERLATSPTVAVR